MENDFLDGIDEAFQTLMERNGTARRSTPTVGRSRDDRLVSEIMEQLQYLSKPQKEEVLKLVRSLQAQKGE